MAPGAADILNLASFVLAPSGYPEEALVLAQKSIALNPNHPAVYFGILGNACRLSRQFKDAISAFEAYNARSPGFGLADLVLTYHDNGQPNQAKDAAKRLLQRAQISPSLAGWRHILVAIERSGMQTQPRFVGWVYLSANCPYHFRFWHSASRKRRAIMSAIG